MQSEETRNHLLKRLAYVLTLMTVMLDAGSIMCPMMAVKNPYLTSTWPVEGLTLAVAMCFTLEELEEGSKSLTAMQQQQLTTADRSDRLSFIPEPLSRLSLNQLLFSVSQPATGRLSAQGRAARAPRVSPAEPMSLVVWGSPSSGYYCTLSLGTPQQEVTSAEAVCVRVCVHAR